MDVDMAAVYWDSSVGLCVRIVRYINSKKWEEEEEEEAEKKTVPPSSPASAAESHKRPIRTDYSSYTRLDSRMGVM